MPDKHLLSFEKDARGQLFKGVEILAKAVVTTLGPKGRNVAIQRQWGPPIVVHDGVTVAREVIEDDALVNMGVSLVKEAAQKTNTDAGDGTTTATLLAYEIVKRGMKLLENGYNPMVLRDEIYEELPKLEAALKKLASPVKKKEEIHRVAYISSADEEIGRLVAEASNKVGKDGLVTVEQGEMKTEVEYTEGMEIAHGWVIPHFITNEQRMEAVVEKPVIAVVNKSLSLNKEIVPLVEAMATLTKSIVIIAQEVKGDALATMAANKMKGNIQALAVAAPPTSREEVLQDIAVATGAKVLDDKTTVDVNNPDGWVGRAKTVIADRDRTAIIGGEGDAKAVKERIEALREQQKAAKTEFEKEQLQQRLSRISTGVAVIKVAAATEIDLREKIERVKDAIGAAKAAREEGIVPGGGVTFLRLREALDGKSEGSRLLLEILQSPLHRLLVNAGESDKDAAEKIQTISSDHAGLGYEVKSGQLLNMVKAGVIDPAKVIRLALENAIAVATSILTTDCLVAFKPGKERTNG